MPNSMTTTARNLICIFGEGLDKALVKVDPIREIIQGEAPQVIQIPDPNAPLIFGFPRAGLDVLFLDNRLQIQSKAPQGAGTEREFGSICAQVLKATGPQTLTAYGFNFDFVTDRESVGSLFGLGPETLTVDSFDYVGDLFVRLSYRRDSTRYTIDFSNVGDKMKVHVNAHHEGIRPLAELAEEISKEYRQDLQVSYQLFEEVVQRDK